MSNIQMKDLKTIQSKYKVVFEESYKLAGPLDRKDTDFPIMYQEIPGKYGKIYWYNAEYLAACCESGKILSRLKKLKGVISAEPNYYCCLFKPDILDVVAATIRAKKKRQYSPETLEKMRELGKRLASRVKAC